MLLQFVDEVRPGICPLQARPWASCIRTAKAAVAVRSTLAGVRGKQPGSRDLFRCEADSIVYLTESFLPREQDGRPPLLLVLGNPASHSVRASMCFAFEKGQRTEHRFWRALAAANWLLSTKPRVGRKKM